MWNYTIQYIFVTLTFIFAGCGKTCIMSIYPLYRAVICIYKKKREYYIQYTNTYTYLCFYFSSSVPTTYILCIYTSTSWSVHTVGYVWTSFHYKRMNGIYIQCASGHPTDWIPFIHTHVQFKSYADVHFDKWFTEINNNKKQNVVITELNKKK